MLVTDDLEVVRAVGKGWNKHQGSPPRLVCRSTSEASMYDHVPLLDGFEQVIGSQPPIITRDDVFKQLTWYIELI